MAATIQPQPMPDDPTDTAADRVRRARGGGVWAARFRTGSTAVIFAREVEALRFAVSKDGTGREVLWVPYGEDVCTYEPPKDSQQTVYRNAARGTDGA